MQITTRKLTTKDREVANHLFSLMSKTFGEEQQQLSDTYLEQLLASKGFWAIAAFSGEELLGGLTAHTLPMTRVEAAEAFIYDIAVKDSHQRQGVGRLLVASLRVSCGERGINVVFVPADNEDKHALDFYRSIGGKPSPVTFFTFDDG
jgi:aminoglycoside 3-N-acetyltransferase I